MDSNGGAVALDFQRPIVHEFDFPMLAGGVYLDHHGFFSHPRESIVGAEILEPLEKLESVTN